MVLPATYAAALLLLILSALAAGSWANTQKLAGAWRFELFYYDYSLGVLLCALIAAFTFGSMLPRELTFQDNLLIAARRSMAYVIAGGVVFNLANILLVAAISVAGMAVAFPISLGVALVVGVGMSFSLTAPESRLLVLGGAFAVLAAIVMTAFAHQSRLDETRRAKAPNPRVDPRARPRAKRIGAVRGIVLGVLSGVLMGLFSPLVAMGSRGDDGVAPFGVAVLFGAGILFSTLLYAPFFVNFPVQGEPIGVVQYFKGTVKQHGLGVLGGAIWMAGAICQFAVAGSTAGAQAGPVWVYALGQSAPVIAALWGLLVWREFKGAGGRIKALLAGMLVLYLVGVGMTSGALAHFK